MPLAEHHGFRVGVIDSFAQRSPLYQFVRPSKKHFVKDDTRPQAPPPPGTKYFDRLPTTVDIRGTDDMPAPYNVRPQDSRSLFRNLGDCSQPLVVGEGSGMKEGPRPDLRELRQKAVESRRKRQYTPYTPDRQSASQV
jgi:hypothetical protein